MSERAVRLASVTLVFAMLAVLFVSIPRGSVAGDVGTRADELILVVGGQDEMKTRNPLPAIANDVWTSDVHGRFHDGVLQSHPVTKELVPYIVKGVDADGDGTFQRDEYGKFLKEDPDSAGNPCNVANGCALQVTAFYDFNGVYFHDGRQVDLYDMLFTYHLYALNPRYNTDLRVIMDDDFTNNRRMNIDIVVAGSGTDWQAPAVGDESLRASVRFTMKTSFALFYESTMAVGLWPEHVWTKFGERGISPVVPNLHSTDFGCMVYPATASGAYVDTTKAGRGIPPGATDLPTGCSAAFNYAAAESWAPTDADMIGMGPFVFETWAQGSFAKVNTNPDFFIGYDMKKNPPLLVDPYIPTYMNLPTIDGILFKIYRSTTLGVLALGRAEIDFYHWNIPAEFVPDMLGNVNIAVEANPEPGFFYMAYNMRREPYGYNGAGVDVGQPLREAISHLVDKKSIVQNLLQNFGVIGHGTISPANTFWYNDGIPKPRFDPTLARNLLDAWGTTDPPGDCTRDNPGGCRSLPVIGTRVTEILTPQADYDPVRAAAGQMIADSLRTVGLNYVSTPLAFGEIVARLDARNFDQYILGWRIGGTDPDYLFSFFHSSNGPAGQNYPGYDDGPFDTLIDNSRAELNRTLRQQYIFDAQVNLANNRPYEVLYYRTNIEGYRQDRYVNWTVSSGTIWNFYSLQGIRPPSDQRIVITPTLPSAVTSEGVAPVTVTVFDQDRNPVSGATVRFQLKTPNTGDFTYLTTTGTDLNVTTDATGQAVVNYNANLGLTPTSASVTVLIDLAASAAGFDPQSRTSQITVFPPGQNFLAVTIALPSGDVTGSLGTLLLEVTVTDQDGFEVNDAAVNIDTGSTSLTANPSSGTSGTLPTVALRAGTVAEDTPVEVTVSATKTGYTSIPVRFQVTIASTPAACPAGEYRATDGTCKPLGGTNIPGPEIVLLIAMVGIIGVVAVRARRRGK